MSEPDIPSRMVRIRRALSARQRIDVGVDHEIPTCRAPSASLYLDQRGDVRACCQNAGFSLGNVGKMSLGEIWRGERAARLRAAVAEDDLSLGCNFCSWQVEDGTGAGVFARTFDHLRAPLPAPKWPEQLELSLSNACNLQCVMCNGEWSSSIRTHREGLPPLPVVYDERFFTDLAEFLPHLRVVKFLGGEPFLGREPLRVLDMLVERGLKPEVHVTTNGTQWSPRIERILNSLDVHIAVSLDGVHSDTYESIRVGSSFEGVVTNIDRFVKYAADRGTGFSLSHCLMRSNWKQFDDFLAFAEKRGSDVYVNTVTEPNELSLYHLPPNELRQVVEGLEERNDRVSVELSGPRLAVWRDQLQRLRSHLISLEAFHPPEYVAKRRSLGFTWISKPEASTHALRALDDVTKERPGWMVCIGSDGVVEQVERRGGNSSHISAWIDAAVVVGVPQPQALKLLAGLEDDAVISGDFATSTREIKLTDESPTDVVLSWAAVRSTDGLVAGVRVYVADTGASSVQETEVPVSEALSAARELGVTHESIEAFKLDEKGMITGFWPDQKGLFGSDLSHLIGQSAQSLSDALEPVLGAVASPPRAVRSTSTFYHHVGGFRPGDGPETQLHSFTEHRGEGSHVWVVRLPGIV